MGLVRIREGETDLLVPAESLSPVPPTVPIFFNPLASTNRSVSVALVDATSGRSFCDSLAGIGARGVRVAVEVGRGANVTLVDINRESTKLGSRIAKLNKVRSRCNFLPREANSYLYSRFGRDEKFDYVDVDPFGTPVQFFQAALSATRNGGVASFTATDTAVLCGVHIKVAERRYGGTPINNQFHHETGVRLLLNAIRREAATLDLGVRPVAVHSTRHYMRVYVRVQVGPTKAEEGRKNEGYVEWCTRCGNLAKVESPERKCAQCGARLKVAGPLWIGDLIESDTLHNAMASASRLGLPEAEKVLSSLPGVDGFPPWSFSIEKICSALRIASVPDSSVAELLTGQGYKTFRQPLEKTGLKTDAGYADVVRAVREAAVSRKE